MLFTCCTFVFITVLQNVNQIVIGVILKQLNMWAVGRSSLLTVHCMLLFKSSVYVLLTSSSCFICRQIRQ